MPPLSYCKNLSDYGIMDTKHGSVCGVAAPQSEAKEAAAGYGVKVARMMQKLTGNLIWGYFYYKHRIVRKSGERNLP